MRGACERVTVWRRDGNSFEREIIPVLCTWRRRAERRLDGGREGAGASGRSVVSVTIPYIPGFRLTPGDLIALGEHDCEITGDKPHRERDIKAALGESVAVIQRVSYNLHGRGEHLKAEGV